jgi:Domain of unknown function (DUF6875)
MELRGSTDSSWRLYTPSEIDHLQSAQPALSEIVSWLRNFLAKPHPALGRPGAVCPFVPLALRLNTIWLTEVPTANPDEEQIKEIVMKCRDLFLELEPRIGENAEFKSILIVFTGLAKEDAPRFIDGIQHMLKPYFVKAGLMIGEFHQSNNTPGLHNPEFFPLRSPIPMLAIRFMVESDIVFLTREIDAPDLRISYLKAYLRRMESVPNAKVNIAEEALAQAELEKSNSEAREV